MGTGQRVQAGIERLMVEKYNGKTSPTTVGWPKSYQNKLLVLIYWYLCFDDLKRWKYRKSGHHCQLKRRFWSLMLRLYKTKTAWKFCCFV